jgi:hypothetical protein
MINKLYSFALGTFIVADEWNANFKAISDSNNDCNTATKDAEVSVAFPDSDLSDLFDAVKSMPNSFEISGNSVVIQPECEYYKALANGEDLAIQIPTGLNAEARVAIYLPSERSLLPFSVLYNGKQVVDYGGFNKFRAGYYFILIYETNGLAQVKLIWTGV